MLLSPFGVGRIYVSIISMGMIGMPLFFQEYHTVSIFG
jgi:hypothetical protein